MELTTHDLRIIINALDHEMHEAAMNSGGSLYSWTEQSELRAIIAKVEQDATNRKANVDLVVLGA